MSNISAVHIIPDRNQIQLYKKIAAESFKPRFQNWKISQNEKIWKYISSDLHISTRNNWEEIPRKIDSNPS